MFTRLKLYPYNLGSQSARNLAQQLGTTRVRPNGRYRYRPNHLIINWGNSHLPQWASPLALRGMLNKPQYIELASDKIATFAKLSETELSRNLPDWTTDRQQAAHFLATPKFPRKLNAVLCRTLTRANSGRGIVLAELADELVPAPLYVRYTPKQQEFRIHVSDRFGIIDVQEKRRRNGADNDENFDPYIRSFNNGWVFCREGLVVPPDVTRVAELALHQLGLNFGAIDIGYHETFGTFIYEVNTAPGLEGQTLTNYVTMFKRYLNAS